MSIEIAIQGELGDLSFDATHEAIGSASALTMIVCGCASTT